MKKVLRYCSVLPALVILFLIFGFSAQDGETSGSFSFRICCAILSFADRLFSWNLAEPAFYSHAESMQFLVRKAAHVTEYFFLALSIFLPLRVLVFHKPKCSLACSSANATPVQATTSNRHHCIAPVLLTFLLSVICAALDEFHQTFVPGRCGSPTDVLVDSVGILFACSTLLFCYYRKLKSKNTTCAE
ncbi:MAG: VanZ family protein [Lachnospiraceae bacterium]|nr:VanZ family protein [Lachnospiraceae bacterium]